MGTFLYRLMGAAVLDGGVYEGLEADRQATWQAAAAVVLSSLAAGIGSTGWRDPSPATFATFTATALVTWIAWAVLTLQIGTKILPGRRTHSDMGELLRTLGFATAPGFLQVFAVVPRMTIPVFAGAWLWTFVATVVAVRHALDYQHTSRALAVSAIAAGLCLTVAVVLAMLLTPTVS